MEYVDIFLVYTNEILMHFIDTLVCSRQDNSDMLKSQQFEL